MKFRVLAISAGGAPHQVRIEAPNAEAAQRVVAGQGMRVIKVESTFQWQWQLPRRQAQLQITTFAQELVALLEAGLTITEAIDALAEREPDAAIRQMLGKIAAEMARGATFSEALENAEGTFPRMLIASARSSERSGGLADALRRFAEYATTAEALGATVRASLVYPALLLGVGALVVAFLLGFVVPKFSEVYREAGRDLPALSRLMLAWGSFARANWQAVLAGSIAGVAFAIAGIKHALRTGAIRRALLAIPAVANLMQAFEYIRLYRALAMLLQAGIPLAQALEECVIAVPKGLTEAVRSAARALRMGQQLSDTLERGGLIEGIALRLIRAGERSGRLSEMLDRAASFEEQRLARTLGTLTRMMEPLLMALLGIVIGGIVVLMYLPIFDMAATIE